ncbi:MAG: DUF4124 domain-containing protein [Pseudomonadota bacterium]
MKNSRTSAALLAATLISLGAMAPAAMAVEIYKWTDAEGNVHYGDRPSGEASEELVAVASSRTDRARVQAGIDARLERDAARGEARQARAEEESARAEERREAEERATACQENRLRLQTYNESPRLYREDENGERVYLDDAERDTAKQRVQEMIDEYCG